MPNTNRMRRMKSAALATDPHCFYCAAELSDDNPDPMQRVTMDHVMPRSRGGKANRRNLVLACAACNVSKGARTLEEWAADILAAAERHRASLSLTRSNGGCNVA